MLYRTFGSKNGTIPDKKKADLYERRERKKRRKAIRAVKEKRTDETKDAKLAFEQAKEAFAIQCKQKETADYEALDALEAAFDFADAAFEKGERNDCLCNGSYHDFHQCRLFSTTYL